MLTFVKGDTNERFIIVTLTELTTIQAPVYYLFVFMHIETKEKLKITFSDSDDESDFKYRYNKFPIQPDVLFQDFPVGHYIYTVYQKIDINNEQEIESEVVEYGRLILLPEQGFENEQYNSQTNFKSYNG